MAESHMLQFVTEGQSYPDKRDAALRAEDFAEIAARYAPDAAQRQSARCSQCGVPYCSVHCPLGNHIPDWLRLTAEGRLQEAYALSNATSTMPEICGRICPQDRLCEGNCVIESAGHGAVTIGAVEKYITDTAWDEGWVEDLRPGRPTGQSVGIIGAGPAGLAAAEHLRLAGHDVTIYDRHDRAGGLLTYGIPGFKLEKPVVERRIARLAAGGIKLELGFAVGADATLHQLRARHNALLIATGVYAPRPLSIPGDDMAGVAEALDYLITANRIGFGEVPDAFADGTLNAAGRHVVVIGGGDTAMDCVRTAIRQGAASVRCLYRRDRANMPGSQREVAHAEEEGVQFDWLSAPEAILGDGKVRAVAVRKMRLGRADASGRRGVEMDDGPAEEIPADLIIRALGYDAEDLPTLFNSGELAVTRWGTLRVDAQMMTAVDGVFAAGDIVRGASLVVWALRDGRDAAQHIHRYLTGAAVNRREAA